VDAAHGAHLGLSAHFPAGAVASGADIVVQSLHKTLPSLTQTAIAHACDTATAARLAAQLDVFQTSSPSYLLLASIDGCMRLLRDRGEELFSRWRAMLDWFYTQTADLSHLSVCDGQGPLVFDHDPGKLLISCHAANITGRDLMARLRNKHHIELEMAGRDYALAMTGMGDEVQNLTRLSLALHAVDVSLSPALHAPALPELLPERVCLPNEALLSEAELVPMDLCADRVCAEYLSVYPPGFPLLVPGERISKDALARLQESELLKSHSKDDPDHIMVLALVNNL
jgi:arginine decarboxylase